MRIPNSFEPHVRSFLESMKVRGYSPQTLKNYGGSLVVFLGYLAMVGIDDVREVSSTIIRNYQLWLQSRNYAGWTILARLQGVRRFFDHLESTQVVLLNPCTHQFTPKLPYRLPKAVLTVEEAKRVLETPDCETPVGLRDKAILEVFYSSGIRLEEMTRLNLADVDWRNGFLRVNQGKFAKDRVVPLGQNAGQWVRRYIDQARAVWSPPSSNLKALWLSSRSPHGALKSQAIEVMVKHYGRGAGLTKPLTPHVWRHSCASHLVASGANVAYVQRLLGHTSLRTTQVYVRTTIPEIKAMHAQAHPRNQESVV